jgi:hypothetical protein
MEVPDWLLKRLVENRPGFEKIPIEFFNDWKFPENEMEFEQFLSYVVTTYEHLFGNVGPKDQLKEVSKEEVEKLIESLVF